MIFEKSVDIDVPNTLNWSVDLEWKFEVREGTTVLFSSGGTNGDFFLAEDLTPELVGPQCEFINNAVSPVSAATILKLHDEDGDGNIDQFLDDGLGGWDITITDQGGNSVTNTTDNPFDGFGGGAITFNFDLGTYTISETQKTGWMQSYPHTGPTPSVAFDCDLPNVCTPEDDGTWTVEVNSTQSITLAFGNFEKPTLKVIKEVVNNNGGEADPEDFMMHVDSESLGVGFSFPGSTNGTTSTLNPGTYTIGEDGVDGYTQTGIVCDNGKTNPVVLDPEENVTCTITNNDDAPSLTLVKQVTNNNGGLEGESNWTLTAAGPTGIGGTGPSVTSDSTFSAGTYNLSESGPSGYTSSNWVCVGGTQDDSDTVTVGLGDDVTCTITNDDDVPSLTLVKVVTNDNGGSASESDWTLFASKGSEGIGGTGPIVSSDSTFTAGTYVLGESGGPSGYTASDWECVGGVQDGDEITIGLGEDVTCTITNDDQVGHLIVHKVTNPADDPTVFSITLSDNPVSGSATQDISVGNDVNYEVDAGTYSVTEAIEAGWDETENTCDDVVVANGGTEKCTITNTQRGHVIIQKNAIPDNNTQAFTFNNNFGNGNPATFNLTDTTAAGLPSYDAEVKPGKYAVSETMPPGWQFESATCDMGETVEDIDVGPGETVTCTFENEKLATIILVKNTIGGNDTFNFVMSGDGLQSGAELATVGNTDSETFNNLNPDNTYTISELVTPGWVLTGSECTGTNTPASITPNAGEEITCTFTNNKPAAQIDLDPLQADNEVGDNHVITANVQVHNGDGVWGPSAGDTLVTFSLVNSNGATASFVGGVNTCTTTSGSCSVTINSPTAGSVSISASSAPVILGVTVNVETDGSGDNSTDADKNYVDASIALSPQEATNDVNEEHEITATVTQNDGDGSDPAVGVTVVFSIASGTAEFVGDDNCVTGGAGTCSILIVDNTPGDNTIDATTTFDVNGISLTRATNGNFGPSGSDAAEKKYEAGIIIVQKVTVGGDGDFEFSADYDSNGFTLSNGDTDNSGFIATGVHSVSETVPEGWDITSATCDDGSDPSNIGLEADETVVCTFENTKRGNIRIIKDADPNDVADFNFTGGLGNFTLDDDEGVAEADTGTHPNSQLFPNLIPGVYTVNETQPNPFWTLNSISCIDVDTSEPYGITTVGNGMMLDLAAGKNIECTFVNEKESPTRTQGFWQTHTAFTTSVFNNIGIGGSMPIGTAPHKGFITNAGQLFGAYYSNISMKSTGKGKNAQRTDVDKARMQLLQQLVTAKLNCAAFGCALSVQNMITAADVAYAGISVSAILASAGALDAYNNSGDTIIISPPLPPVGNATPKDSQALVDKAFWDAP